MHRRPLLLALSATVVASVASTTALALPAGAVATRPSASTSRPADLALQHLQQSADRSLRIRRSEGRVAFVGARDGRAVASGVRSDSPAQAARDHLSRFGAVVGLGGPSTARVRQTLPSSTGGSVVRADQLVDGVPVFGGQVITTLDRDNGLVSMTAATSAAQSVPVAVVAESRARRTALSVVARDHHLRTGALTATPVGEQVYDPAVVHTDDPLGARPVWRFEVGNGSDVRETVLVGTHRGEVVLHFDEVEHLDAPRKVCDDANAQTLASSDQVPTSCATARTNGSAASSVADVDQAYDNLGEVAQAYQDLDGKDLAALIGVKVGTTKTLQATVRWCYTDADCPYANAFWDGQQMVFGAGYAGADDVVGHELTHGYVDRTSQLFYLHQSAAINESLADTIGEIVDHRNGTDDDSSWSLGEDLPNGADRSLKDPTIFQQPDRMTSPLWGTSDAFDPNGDAGDAHLNDGVGNKTAYLISQGGTFDNQTITGIDGTDAGLSKTGRLYLETIPTLTSGADYADLGTALLSTCQRLAGAGTGGFTSADCTSVAAATAATELSTTPTGAAAQAPVSCTAPGTSPLVVARQDDAADNFRFTTTGTSLWFDVAPPDYVANAIEGKHSLFGQDPDPSLGDPSSSTMTSSALVVPQTDGGSFFHFAQDYLFDHDPDYYYDGGQALVQHLVDGTWSTVTGLPWTNGPSRTIHATGGTFTGFGGDSYGWGSSQVDLSSLKGQTVRFLFRVAGDDVGSAYGWWIDDLSLYSCALPTASAPTSLKVAASTTSARLTWGTPASSGSGVDHFVVTRSDGRPAVSVPASARSATLAGFTGASPVTLRVAAVGPDKAVAPAAAATVLATTATLSSSATKVKRNVAFTLTAKVVRRGASTLVPSMPVTLQRRYPGSSTWSTVSSGTTGSHGTRAWSVKQSRTTYYRVLARGVTTWFGSTSSSRTVAMR